MSADDILSLYRADLEVQRSATPEFPVTPMSAALGRAIQAACADIDPAVRATGRALDFGTGSGIHAAILSDLGWGEVRAVDESIDAVPRAQARFDRLRGLPEFVGHGARPGFAVASFAEESRGKPYDLIVTNPPSYRTDVQPTSPLEYGVFDWCETPSDAVEVSFLYRFFGEVVAHSLKPGGRVICTWPALQARLVHLDGDRRLVHPAEMLHRWFGWQLDGENPSSATFFSHTAETTYENLSTAPRGQIVQDIDAGKFYSPFTVLIPGAPRKIQFPFGILCLARHSDDPKRFDIHTATESYP